jgi:hypothetical protein
LTLTGARDTLAPVFFLRGKLTTAAIRLHTSRLFPQIHFLILRLLHDRRLRHNRVCDLRTFFVPRQEAHGLKNKLTELFGFDLRSLAALRVAVAVLIIGDLISRSRDLEAHYTDFGVVPRSVIALYDRWRISVHMMSGTWEIQAVLFAVTGALAVLLLFGYRTRLMTAVLWFLLASLDSRNPFIADGGDTLLRLT